MRDLGQEISGPGVRHQPVPEPSRSSAPGTRALATSKLIATNFSRLAPCAELAAWPSRVRRATPSGGSRHLGSPVQSPFIPFGPWRSPWASRRPPLPSAGLREGWARQCQCPGTRRGMDRTANRKESLGHPRAPTFPRSLPAL